MQYLASWALYSSGNEGGGEGVLLAPLARDIANARVPSYSTLLSGIDENLTVSPQLNA